MDKNRKTAYQVLLDMEKNHSYSNLALNYFLNKNNPDNPAFVRELVYGVVKQKILLDYRIAKLIPSGLKKVKDKDLILLRMGAYQISFMDSVPAYAAVNEAVSMARALAKGREGFINGVLRSYSKNEGSWTLPDDKDGLVGPLSIQYSVSEWIVDLWLKAYGPAETEKILVASNGTPELSLRVNTNKCTVSELVEALEKEGFSPRQGLYSKRAILLEGKNTGVLNAPLFGEGYFSVQDQASIMAADALQPKKGDLVVDVCAAPGGKTLAMAEAMGNEGEIYALDIYDHKLKLIEDQARRLGISIIKTECHDGQRIKKELVGKADCVMADVPCSGLGVLRRKPEIKYRSDQGIEELPQIQRQILENASAYVKQGGRLVYSTCTINPDENEKQVNMFLSKNPEFRLDYMEQLMPTAETDGFFISRMIRA